MSFFLLALFLTFFISLLAFLIKVTGIIQFNFVFLNLNSVTKFSFNF